MTTELTFQNQEGTHFIKYIVLADCPVMFSELVTKASLEVAARLGPAMTVENRVLYRDTLEGRDVWPAAA